MTYDEYEKIKKLEELLKNGTITQEEFDKEREKIISSAPKAAPSEKPVAASTRQPLMGIEENLYLLLMHLSQFLTAFIIPLVMWLVGKDENKRVDFHGKNILNFQITYIIWLIVGIITIPLIIGIVILSVLGIAMTVFIIVAAVKSYNGEDWKYPLTINFLK
ncbi:MAG: DUF4870 domain-containing protein [Paludibacteraceae bacterium]